MGMVPADSIGELRFPAVASATPAVQPSKIEFEIMRMFEEFRTPLLRYVLSFGMSVHDAEDITQEIFLSLFRHLQLRRSRKNLRGWLFRVAHNLALKRRYANQKWSNTASADWAIAEGQPDPAPNPEEQVSSAQTRRRLLAVVDALAEADRSCLKLRAEGLRYREIAAVLNISLGAVSLSLTRSVARLMRAERI
jgi:RNA polymerase sigma-70 factor (ECF subfamily)